MTKNTKATIWAIVAVMTVIVGITTYQKQRPKRSVIYEASAVVKTAATIPDQTQIATSTEAATSTSITVATSTSSNNPAVIYRRKKPTPAIPPLSYGDAVTKYMNSRIQFNQNCQAIPGQTVLANPVTIMLDNRSDQTQVITIAGHSYSVTAYNYVLVTLNEKNLPETLHVNCNNQMNSLQILLQR
jgi:hypothetical protein